MLAEAAQGKWCWLAGWLGGHTAGKKALGWVQNKVLVWPPGTSGITCPKKKKTLDVLC